MAIPKAEEPKAQNFNQYTSDAGAKYQLPTFYDEKDRLHITVHPG